MRYLILSLVWRDAERKKPSLNPRCWSIRSCSSCLKTRLVQTDEGTRVVRKFQTTMPENWPVYHITTRRHSAKSEIRTRSFPRDTTIQARPNCSQNTRKSTYVMWTGWSGPRSLDPSQKQSSGVMIEHGNRFSRIWKWKVETLIEKNPGTIKVRNTETVLKENSLTGLSE